MDKNTLGNYGWVVITVIIISIMIALASPFAVALKGNVVGVTNDFTGRLEAALDDISNNKEEASGFCFMQTIDDGNFRYTYLGYETEEEFRAGTRSMYEEQLGVSFEDVLEFFGMTEDEFIDFVKEKSPYFNNGEPEWSVYLIDKNTTGDIIFPAYFQNIPVVSVEGIIQEGPSNLTNVTFPNTVKLIDGSLFDNTITLTILATTPPVSTTSTGFGSSSVFHFSSATAIYVPVESVEVYKNASGWSEYADIIQAIPTT